MHQFSGALNVAASIWAAAAGACGAYAPQHIADALCAHPADLVAAVRAGCAAAKADADEEGGCAPRGCSVDFGTQGEEELVWRTSVEVTLRPRAPSYEPDGWQGTVFVPQHPIRLAAAQQEAARHGVELTPPWE